MNDSLHDLQSDIQRLAQQQSQIQIMMSGPRMETSPGPPQQPQHNPMDPQPFYIASPDPPTSTPTRRTWGQPQPISFAHQQPQGPMDPNGWQSMPRRGQWGAPLQQQPQQPQRPQSYYGGGSQYGDPYGPPMRDQWGNPIMPQGGGPMYNGQQYPDQQYGGYTNPMYAGNYGGYGQQPQIPPAQPATGSPYYPSPPVVPPRTPFRLHDGPKASSPLAAQPGNGSHSPSATSATLSVAQRLAALNRRTSESESSSVTQPLNPMTFSRQNSRDSVSSNRDVGVALGVGASHRPHSSVPAPEEDEMLPQNVSFIDSSAEDEPDR